MTFKDLRVVGEKNGKRRWGCAAVANEKCVRVNVQRVATTEGCGSTNLFADLNTCVTGRARANQHGGDAAAG